MTRYTMIAFSNATDGADDRFNIWYDTRHLADICDVPGVVKGQRFAAVTGSNQSNYRAIYELETEDPKALLGEIDRRVGTASMPVSDALDRSSIFLGIFALLNDAASPDAAGPFRN